MISSTIVLKFTKTPYMFSIYLLQDLWQECNIIDYKNVSSCILHSLWIGKRKKIELTKRNLTRQEESWTKLAKKLQWSRMLHKTRTTKQVNVNAHERGALSKTCKKTTLHETKATKQVNTNAHEKGSLRRACKKYEIK